METIPLAVLILLTVLLPLVWGWMVYWLIARHWPPSERDELDDGVELVVSPYDYQI